MTRVSSRLLRGDPSAPSARIGVCIVISDPLLARRVTSLLSGDMHFRLSFELEDNPDPDVILADHVQMMAGPSIIIDDGGQNLNAEGDVRAVLPPNVDGDLLRAAIRIVSAGLMIGEADEPSRFSDGSSKLHRPLAGTGAGIALTAREGEVLGLLVHGASNKSIARDLDISIHTAKFHVASLLGKLGARNRSDAVAIAISRGLVFL
jgi:two-component system, NarL family, nitrate/nitrite response regulator NarL